MEDRLSELKSELEKCRGGGRIGRIKSRIIQAQIARIESTMRTRPDKDTYFLRHAVVASQMATCKRRSVGCVVVNARRQILGVGYNGVPSGMPHCNEGHPCPGADAPSGTNLSGCFAPHAEVNAVIQCRDPYAIDTVYTTTAPCVDCTKFLMNTSAQRIVFIEPYPHPEARQLWEQVGRSWIQSPIVGGWSLEVGKLAFPREHGDGLVGRAKQPDPECPRCGGTGGVSVGGGCMGCDDEPCDCLK